MTVRPSPTRVGFLGVGNIAREHAEALQALGHTVVAGCATSADSPRWREFKSIAPEARFEPDGCAILEGPDVDAVVACLPWNVTETWLPKLLSTPKPVLIEKPVALSSSVLAEAMAAPEARLENKFTGYNRRFYRTVQELKARVLQGGIKSIEITLPETVGRLSDTFGPEMIEHTLVYSSCHTLDTMVYLVGMPRPVKIYGHWESGYARPFQSLAGLLELDDGTPVFLSIMADNPAPMGIRIFFDDQSTWHLSPLERLIAYRGYERLEPVPGAKIPRYLPQPFLEINEDADLKPGFLDQMDAFLSGRCRQIAATLEEDLELLHLIETLQRMPDADERIRPIPSASSSTLPRSG